MKLTEMYSISKYKRTGTKTYAPWAIRLAHLSGLAACHPCIVYYVCYLWSNIQYTVIIDQSDGSAWRVV